MSEWSTIAGVSKQSATPVQCYVKSTWCETSITGKCKALIADQSAWGVLVYPEKWRFPSDCMVWVSSVTETEACSELKHVSTTGNVEFVSYPDFRPVHPTAYIAGTIVNISGDTGYVRVCEETESCSHALLPANHDCPVHGETYAFTEKLRCVVDITTPTGMYEVKLPERTVEEITGCTASEIDGTEDREMIHRTLRNKVEGTTVYAVITAKTGHKDSDGDVENSVWGCETVVFSPPRIDGRVNEIQNRINTAWNEITNSEENGQ